MTLQEALDTALALEHKIRDLYAASARAAGDPKGQRVFAILAREEQGHVEHLEALKRMLAETGQVVPGPLKTVLPDPVWIAEQAAKLKGDASASGQASDTFHTELDLLKDALELERKAGSMYQDLVDQVAPEHRHVFEAFLDSEEGHLGLVQAEIASVEGFGTWFDVVEFSLEQ